MPEGGKNRHRRGGGHTAAGEGQQGQERPQSLQSVGVGGAGSDLRKAVQRQQLEAGSGLSFMWRVPS